MEQTIAEGNKIIAEFMGCQIDKDHATMHVWIHGDQTTMFYCEWHPELKMENERIIAWEFAPHENWCQLMPVVEKIMKLKLKPDEDRMYIRECDHYTMPIFNSAGEADIKALFPAVVKFIQWYNKNSKP